MATFARSPGASSTNGQSQSVASYPTLPPIFEQGDANFKYTVCACVLGNNSQEGGTQHANCQYSENICMGNYTIMRPKLPTTVKT